VKLVSHSVLALLSEPVVAIHSGASCMVAGPGASRRLQVL
jgi:hypothetical protein